jgi:hypothetical protein
MCDSTASTIIHGSNDEIYDHLVLFVHNNTDLSKSGKIFLITTSKKNADSYVKLLDERISTLRTCRYEGNNETIQAIKANHLEPHLKRRKLENTRDCWIQEFQNNDVLIMTGAHIQINSDI